MPNFQSVLEQGSDNSKCFCLPWNGLANPIGGGRNPNSIMASRTGSSSSIWSHSQMRLKPMTALFSEIISRGSSFGRVNHCWNQIHVGAQFSWFESNVARVQHACNLWISSYEVEGIKQTSIITKLCLLLCLTCFLRQDFIAITRLRECLAHCRSRNHLAWLLGYVIYGRSFSTHRVFPPKTHGKKKLSGSCKKTLKSANHILHRDGANSYRTFLHTWSLNRSRPGRGDQWTLSAEKNVADPPIICCPSWVGHSEIQGEMSDWFLVVDTKF